MIPERHTSRSGICYNHVIALFFFCDIINITAYHERSMRMAYLIFPYHKPAAAVSPVVRFFLCGLRISDFRSCFETSSMRGRKVSEQRPGESATVFQDCLSEEGRDCLCLCFNEISIATETQFKYNGGIRIYVSEGK